MSQKKTRRQFIGLGIKAGVGVPLLGSGLLQKDQDWFTQSVSAKASSPLNILILGGTSFLGPQQIAYALGRGHSIATFTRGRTEPTVHTDIFEKVEQLIGDRANDLKSLENRKWDAVIDNSGQRVEWTRKSAQLLKDNVGLYLYTSSTGVYYPYLKNNIAEDATLVMEEPAGITDDAIHMEYRYGVMKANSEVAAREAFGPDRTIVVRPTYMIGPGDRTDRFIYWPVRLSRGGATLVPGKPADPVQYIDVRDVAEWMIRLIEEKKAGTYNAVGPREAQGMRAFVTEAAAVFPKERTWVQVDDYNFLKEHNLLDAIPWILPEGNNLGSATIDNRKGFANGLTARSLKETVTDTYGWWNSDAVGADKRNEYESKPGSLLVAESSIIEAWKTRKKT